MKIFAFVSLALGLAFAQNRDDTFNIRFEPTAILQTGAPIPFRITVDDDRHKPIRGAKVTLEITTKEPLDTKIVKATETDPGTYIAKPVFEHAGEWNVYVEAMHDRGKTTRTKQVLIP
ncbi:MAG: FixH family protein [Bryobacteraceae bacterium]